MSDWAEASVELAKSDAESVVADKIQKSVPAGVRYHIRYDRYHYDPNHINPKSVYVRGYAYKA